MKDDRKLPEIPPEPVGSGRPEIYAVKTKNAGAFLTRRSFLGAMAAAGALSACDSGKSPNGAEGPKAPECLKPSHLGPVRGLLTIGDKLFSWCDHSFNVWSWPTGALVDKVMTNSDDSVVWEPPEPFPVLFQRLGPGPRTVSFSADGRRLADIDVEKGLVEVWGSEGGAPTKIQAMAYGEWAMMSAGLSADGEMVAVGRTGGRIDIWNVGDQ